MHIDDDIYASLRRMETELVHIRENTAPVWWHAVWDGLVRGTGFAIGGIAALAFLGWLLTILDVIPGFEEMATNLQMVLNSR